MTRKILFLSFVILVSANLSYSQKLKNEPFVIKTGGGSCEENSAIVDGISTEILETKERIFVIFRAGKGETEIVNARRLNHVKWFLQNRKDWKIFDVIYARGEKSYGEGKIEFYSGKRFFLVVMSAKNRTPCLDCCNGGLEYPQNLIKKPRSVKQKS